MGTAKMQSIFYLCSGKLSVPISLYGKTKSCQSRNNDLHASCYLPIARGFFRLMKVLSIHRHICVLHEESVVLQA